MTLSETHALAFLSGHPEARKRGGEGNNLSKGCAFLVVDLFDVSADRSDKRAGRSEVTFFHVLKSCLPAALGGLLSVHLHVGPPSLRSPQ